MQRRDKRNSLHHVPGSVFNTPETNTDCETSDSRASMTGQWQGVITKALVSVWGLPSFTAWTHQLNLVVCDATHRRILHRRTDGQGFVGRTNCARNKLPFAWVLLHVPLRTFLGELCGLPVNELHFLDGLQRIVCHGYSRPIEGVRLDDVSSGVEELIVNSLDHVRPGDDQEVIVALQLMIVVLVALPAEIFFIKLVFLDACAHSPIDVGDATLEQLDQLLERCGRGRVVLRTIFTRSLIFTRSYSIVSVRSSCTNNSHRSCSSCYTHQGGHSATRAFTIAHVEPDLQAQGCPVDMCTGTLRNSVLGDLHAPCAVLEPSRYATRLPPGHGQI